MNRIPLRVARTEFRRTVRVVSASYTRLALYGLMVLFFFGPLALAAVYLLPTIGAAVADGAAGVPELFTVTDVVTGGVASLWLFLVVMVTMRVVTTVADVDEPAFLLVSTSIRNAVLGLMGAEVLRVGVWTVPPVVLLAVAFSYGYGAALPVVLVLVVFALVFLTAVAVAFPIGICIRHVLTVYEPIARFRTPLFALLGLAYFGSIALGWFDAITATVFTGLTGSPLGWPGHLLLVAVPAVDPSIEALVGTALGVLVVVPVAVLGSVRAAEVHWFSDPARTDDDSAAATGSTHRLEGLVSPFASGPVRTVAVTAIRRTVRAPVRLLYVAYPLFGAIFFVQDVVQTGTITVVVAVLLCLYVVWGAGALFTLNPLGDYGRALPAVLTSTVSGRQAIGGVVLAAGLVAVPVAIVVSLVVGTVSPLDAETTALLVVGTVAGAVATPALATGVGTLFPRFGSVNVTQNREAVMPSKAAFLVYTVGIALPAGAAAVLFSEVSTEAIAAGIAAVVALVSGFDLAIPGAAVAGAAWGILVAGLVAPVGSLAYAIRVFDGFTVD